MSRFFRWSFEPLISRNQTGLPICTLDIDECELCILWTLGKKGKRSIYDLGYKETYDLPEQVNSSIAPIVPKEKVGKREPYEYPFVRKSVLNLEKKGLVKITRDTTGNRTRKVVELTFPGLSLYLRGSVERDRFRNAIKHHSKLIPFSKQWESVKKLCGEEKCTETFSQTANSCINLIRAKFRVRPVKLDFEGFMKTTFPVSHILRKTVRERDEKFSEYLGTEKALVLRDSYIAYLVMKDLSQLSGENLDYVEGILSKLESEKEFSYLVKNRDPTPLFKSKKLREFLPKYASIEYFFTGMFVENLLWHENAEKEESHDFEVEIC